MTGQTGNSVPESLLPLGADLARDASEFSARGQRTRQRIVEAARSSLEDVGYPEANVTMITQRAEVSLGTFYRYFDNKETLFLVLLQQLVEELYEASGGTWVPEDVERSLYEATFKYLSAYYDNRLLIAALRDMASVSTDAARMWWTLRSATHSRMDRHLVGRRPEAQEPEPSMLVSALGGMVEQYAYYWYVEAKRHGRSVPSIEASAGTLSQIWYHAVYAG